MLRSILLFALSTALHAQYTWHSTTSTVPPDPNQWIDLNQFYYGAPGFLSRTPTHEGGEVRTTVIRNTNWGNRYQYEHLLGMIKYFTYSGEHGEHERWKGYRIIFYYDGYWSSTATIYYEDNGLRTQVAVIPTGVLTDGSTLSSTIRYSDGPNGPGAGITVRVNGNEIFYFRNTTVPGTGHPNYPGLHGFNVLFPMSDTFREVRVGPLDTSPPTIPGSLSTSLNNGILTATWTASTDSGIGDIHYDVFRGNTFIGKTTDLRFTMPVQPGESFTLSVWAMDGHRNYSWLPANIAVTVPGSVTQLIDDSRRVGIHVRSATWGALGEAIDTRSMNLNYTVPLLKALGRGGLTLPVALSYNSQNWRRENSNVTQLGADVGYGYGWRLAAGSITPVYTNPTTLAYYVYIDATGAEYKLDLTQGGVWWSRDPIRVWYDSNKYQLRFADGSFWRMESISGASEQDAGSQYPTLIQDRNGNQIKITYRPSIGGTLLNQSARIQSIEDIRAAASTNFVTYSFSYNTDAIPHLTSINNLINTAESWTAQYSSSQPLIEPFNNANMGAAVRLTSILQTGVNLTTTFHYNSAVELSQITFPLGGQMLWTYGTQSYANGRQIREVRSRDLRKTSGDSLVAYVFSHPLSDTGLKYHSSTQLSDPSNVGQRRWNYHVDASYVQGLLSVYDELDGWNVRARTSYSYRDAGSGGVGWPVLEDIERTIDFGLPAAKILRTKVSEDVNGFSSSQTVYAYNSSTVKRSQSCLTTGTLPTYVANYILYDTIQCKVIENGSTLNGPAITLDSFTFLSPLPSGVRLWADPNNVNRGLLSSVNNGYTNQTMSYNQAGQATVLNDGQGLSENITYGGVGGSTVPTQVTPNLNATMATIYNWNGFLGLTLVNQANGMTQSFGYDAWGRPSQQTSPDGAITYYGYNVAARTSSLIINGRSTTTTYDGLGRPVRVTTVAAGSQTTQVDTEYEPCACSPIGKVKRVSLPYHAGNPIFWTVYTYDGLGRTISVAQPNNAGVTTYFYAGNTVKVTSPSGKWKTYVQNELGQLVEVIEPRPGGGTWSTTYTYNSAGKITQVSMPRDGVVQTRTFTYDSITNTRLLSATNPENGTVTYTYNPDGTTATKTDAKGIRTEFSYDSYKRVTRMSKLLQSNSAWVENRCERVTYVYDEQGGTNWGRLTSMHWNWTVNAQNQTIPCPTGGGFIE
ncbi:MAG: RHS repeat domain-containing protein, partial [Acidobacteriota bacterium]